MKETETLGAAVASSSRPQSRARRCAIVASRRRRCRRRPGCRRGRSRRRSCPPNGRGTWWARPMPSRHRSTGARVTSRPSNSPRPLTARSAPASTFRSVVFPAPLGPTMPTASPAPTAKSTSSRTTSAPNLFRSACGGERPGAVAVLTPSDAIRRSFAAIGTFWSAEFSTNKKSSLYGPDFAFIHWPPGIGVATTFAFRPVAPVQTCRRGVST